MSTAARKERKRAGIKFFKEPKVGTPVRQLSRFNKTVEGPVGTFRAGRQVPINPRHLRRALEARGQQA